MNTNEHEFEEMRQQMQTLKKKLEKQEIVNDRLIRQSMKRNVSNINRTYLALMVLGLLMIPYSYWAFIKLSGFSVAFWIGTCVFMLICVGATYYNGLRLRDKHLMTYNLLDVRQTMARAKRVDSQWLLFSIPMLLVWLGWFAYEVHSTHGSDELRQGLLWGGIFGGIIGAIIGFSIHFKTQRQYQEIIDQIEDLSRE